MVRQLQKDRFSARFIEDIEAVASEPELKTVKIDDLIQKLRDWYRPAQNPTTKRFHFHRLAQRDEETFESFVSKVKSEAKSINFRCNSVGCDVQAAIIRDQIILGAASEDLRRRALREEWNLEKLEEEGRSVESAEVFSKFGERLRNASKTKSIEKNNKDTDTLKSKDAPSLLAENLKAKLQEKEKPKLFEKVAAKNKSNDTIGKLRSFEKDSGPPTKLKYHDKESSGAKMKTEKQKYLAAKESAKLKQQEKEYAKLTKQHHDGILKSKKEIKSKKHIAPCRCDRDRDPYPYDHYAAIKIPCHPCNQRGMCSSCVMCSNHMLDNTSHGSRRFQKVSERDMFSKKMCHQQTSEDSCSASDTEDMYKGKSAKAYHVTDDSGTPYDTEIDDATDTDVFVAMEKQNNSNNRRNGKNNEKRTKTVYRAVARDGGERGAQKKRHRRRRRKKTDYKVDIGINEQTVTVTTDTGAEINVLPRHTAEALNLPLQTSEMKISPYGAKPFQVVGKYEGIVNFGPVQVKSKWYIVDKKNIEPLLSGVTAEQLGIIKFINKPSELNPSHHRRSEKLTDDTKAKYYLEKLERAFNGLGKLNGYDVELHINDEYSNIDNSTPCRQTLCNNASSSTNSSSCKPDFPTSPLCLDHTYENEINWMNEHSPRENSDDAGGDVASWQAAGPSSQPIKITVDMKRSKFTTTDEEGDLYITQQEDIVERRMSKKKLNRISIYDR